MAKSTTGKKDPQDTQASERRRRSANAAQTGADESTTQQARTRRKPTSRREPDTERASVAAATENLQTTGTGRVAPERLAARREHASADPSDRPTAEEEAATQIDVPHEHIAVRAYHRYLERGGRAGDDLEDWITAERELRERIAGYRAR
jgi:hypothetical protein